MPDALLHLKSHLEGLRWPALPSPHGATLLSLLYQLESSQWWPEEKLLAAQLRQLTLLLRHARATVPYYRRALPDAGEQLTLERWRALPILRRSDLQAMGRDLASEALPAEFGTTADSQTSGATGQPVTVRKSRLDGMIWEATTMREHLWHRRDFGAKLAVIRPFSGALGAPPDGTLLPDWGPPANLLFGTGPAAVLSLSADVATQAEWLKRQRPDYLLTFPNNLMALIRHFRERGAPPPPLLAARTVSETVSPALRAACGEFWNAPIEDSYSSQELGHIAIQCPESGLYHVMAEAVLVEVLADDGSQCRPGEIGRLVVTSLHNYAMPLIRYEVRDYAEPGAPCPCGRGLPTLARIVGRNRNMLVLPDGRRRWPLVGFMAFREIAPVRQFQLVQHALHDIEVRLSVERELTRGEEGRLAGVINEALGHPYALRFSCSCAELSPGPGGKFEEFVSKLAD
jgi:phenylacetate-CoA ligase